MVERLCVSLYLIVVKVWRSFFIDSQRIASRHSNIESRLNFSTTPFYQLLPSIIYKELRVSSEYLIKSF